MRQRTFLCLPREVPTARVPWTTLLSFWPRQVLAWRARHMVQISCEKRVFLQHQTDVMSRGINLGEDLLQIFVGPFEQNPGETGEYRACQLRLAGGRQPSMAGAMVLSIDAPSWERRRLRRLGDWKNDIFPASTHMCQRYLFFYALFFQVD